jgi:hypothetical protein
VWVCVEGASLMRGPECVGVCGGGKLNERTGMCGCVWRGQAFKTDKQKKKILPLRLCIG